MERIAQLSLHQRGDFVSKIPLFFSEQDFTPDKISGLQLWLDASNIVQSDGTAVTSWVDRSTNTNAVSMSTTASQPIVKNNILNGKPVIRFDGVDDYLDLTYPFDYKIYQTHSGCAWSPDGTYFAVGVATVSPYLAIYKRSGNTFTKLATPATTPTGGAQKLKFSPDGNYLAVPHSSSPFITVYKRTGDTFTKLTNPTTLPVGNANSVAWASDSKSFIVTSSAGTGNRVAVYSLDQLTDTLTYQNPGFSGGDVYSDVTLASNDTSLVFTYTNASPYIMLATYDKSTYQITSLSPLLPDVIPTGAGNGCSFSPDGTYLAVAHTTTPFISVYFRSGTTYTKLANPTSLPTGNGAQVSWSADNTYLALSHGTSPYMGIFQKSGTGALATITRLSSPSTLPQNNGAGIAFSPAGGYLAVGNTTSGYLTMYTQSGSTFTAITKNDMLRNVGGATAFVVAKYPANSLANYTFVATSGTSVNAPRMTAVQTTTNKLGSVVRRLDADVSATLAGSTSIIANSLIQTNVMDYSTGSASIYLNNTLDGTNATLTTAGTTSGTTSYAVQIGSFTTLFFAGDIAEIIVYNKALTATEISGLNKYLGTKWGITVA